MRPRNDSLADILERREVRRELVRVRRNELMLEGHNSSFAFRQAHDEVWEEIRKEWADEKDA